MSRFAVSLLLLQCLLFSQPAGAQESGPIPITGTQTQTDVSAPRADAFKASAKTGQDFWEPLVSETRILFIRAALAAAALILCFILGPVFWTLAATCGAAAAYWGAAAMAGGSVLFSKMPEGQSMGLFYALGGAAAIGVVLLSWLAMLVLLVPKVLGAAVVVSGKLDRSY